METCRVLDWSRCERVQMQSIGKTGLSPLNGEDMGRIDQNRPGLHAMSSAPTRSGPRRRSRLAKVGTCLSEEATVVTVSPPTVTAHPSDCSHITSLSLSLCMIQEPQKE